MVEWIEAPAHRICLLPADEPPESFETDYMARMEEPRRASDFLFDVRRRQDLQMRAFPAG
jgi:hypothetical protein